MRDAVIPFLSGHTCHCETHAIRVGSVTFSGLPRPQVLRLPELLPQVCAAAPWGLPRNQVATWHHAYSAGPPAPWPD